MRSLNWTPSGRPSARVPWWGLVSSFGAPLLLVGGWTVAAALQPAGFDPTVDSISALAARDAHDRWVMTLALLVVGGCHVSTALALRPARAAGRAILALGGLATVLVALVPLPGGGAGSTGHLVAATLAFVALTVWPACSARRRAAAVGLRPPVAVGAAVVLAGLLGWYVAELVAGGGYLGLAERVMAAAQACCPALVVTTARRSRVTLAS